MSAPLSADLLLRCVVVCGSVLQRVAEKGVDVRTTVRQFVVTVCCYVLQCVAKKGVDVHHYDCP